MRRMFMVLCVSFCMLLCCRIAQAMPLDLSGFTAEDDVVVSGGEVSFTETMDNVAWYFFNDNFLVENDATILSFDYDFQLGPDDVDDYFTFELDFFPELEVDANTSAGHYDIDLSSYQGSEVSLAWGLIWGGDFDAGSTARLYNIDLATESNVIPEPCTLFLFSTGLAGVFGSRKKRRIRT